MIHTKNVKKKSAHDILYGEDKETGEIRHITEVISGAQCGCICIACKRPLEARKGEIRRHHFAHVSNYECLYAAEVAIYKKIAEILDDKRTLSVPPVVLRIQRWNDTKILRDARTLQLQTITCSCDSQQYPPVLEVTVRDNRLRLFINFGNYYTEEDQDILSSEAHEEGYSSLMLWVPDIQKNAEYFTPDNLAIQLNHVENMRWLRSAVEEQHRDKYRSKAHEPNRNSAGYECPIHIAKYDGMYAARKADCTECRFNLGTQSQCLCIGHTGIQSIQDIELPEEDLNARVQKLRQENEERIARGEQRRKLIYQNITKHPVTRLPLQNKTPILGEADSRRILCECCGKMKPPQDMVDYGGVRGPDRGICRECSRTKYIDR